MKNTVGYKLVKNNTQTAEQAPYFGMAIPVGSLAYGDILDKMLDAGTRLSRPTAEYFLKALYEYAADKIGEDVVRLSLGSVSLYPAISGSFDSEDAAFDPTRNTLYVGASLSQSLRDAVAGIEPAYGGDDVSSSAVKLMSVMDVATETMGIIDGTNDFRLAGVELTVPDGEDESLALVTKSGLVKVCDIVVSANDGGQRLTCHLPSATAIAKGSYLIRLASHGLDPTAPLAVRTLSVTLVTAVTPSAKKVITLTDMACSEAGGKITGTVTNGEGVTGYDATSNTFKADVYKNGELLQSSEDVTWNATTKAIEYAIGASFSSGDTAKLVLHPDPAKTEYEQNDVSAECTVTA